MRKSVRLSSILCSNTLDDAVPWRHLAMCVQRSSGSAIPLSPDQIKRVLKVVRSERYADRAELLLSLSIQLGMRATELASLKWIKAGLLSFSAEHRGLENQPRRRRSVGASSGSGSHPTALPAARARKRIGGTMCSKSCGQRREGRGLQR